MQGIVRYQRRLRWLCRKRIIIHLFYILVSAWKVLNPMFTKMNIKHSSQSKGKSTLNIHWKDWCWNPILWLPDAKSGLIRKDPDAGKDWRQEEDDRGQDDWVISLTQRTWIWASSRRWWRTGKPGVLHSMGPQTVRHDWVTGYQQGLKQSTNCELPDVQGGFRKGGRTRDQTTSIHWIKEKKGEFQKNIYFSFIDYMRAFDVLITTNCGKFWDYQTTLSVFWETCMQVKEQQ